jgi:hypothetical protein
VPSRTLTEEAGGGLRRVAGVAGAAVTGLSRLAVALAEEGGGGHDEAEAVEETSVPILTERILPAVAGRAGAVTVELGVAWVEGLAVDLVGVEAAARAVRGCWALQRFSRSGADRAVAGRLCWARAGRAVAASFVTSARAALAGLSSPHQHACGRWRVNDTSLTQGTLTKIMMTIPFYDDRLFLGLLTRTVTFLRHGILAQSQTQFRSLHTITSHTHTHPHTNLVRASWPRNPSMSQQGVHLCPRQLLFGRQSSGPKWPTRGGCHARRDLVCNGVTSSVVSECFLSRHYSDGSRSCLICGIGCMQ